MMDSMLERVSSAATMVKLKVGGSEGSAGMGSPNLARGLTQTTAAASHRGMVAHKVESIDQKLRYEDAVDRC